MKRRLIAIVASAMTVATANATLFYGTDIDKGPTDARPNSDAAHASFLSAASAIGSVATEDFESQTLGSASNVNLGNGLHVGFTNISSANGIVDNPQDQILGYNTTSGGIKYLSLGSEDRNFSVFSVITFDTPVNSFGAYFTAIGTAGGTVTVQWNDGANHTIGLPGNILGGVSYFGFTGTGEVSSIRIGVDSASEFIDDVLGVDDIQYSRSSVPEPASLAAVSIGGLALLKRRNRKKGGAR